MSIPPRCSILSFTYRIPPHPTVAYVRIISKPLSRLTRLGPCTIFLGIISIIYIHLARLEILVCNLLNLPRINHRNCLKALSFGSKELYIDAIRLCVESLGFGADALLDKYCTLNPDASLSASLPSVPSLASIKDVSTAVSKFLAFVIALLSRDF